MTPSSLRLRLSHFVAPLLFVATFAGRGGCGPGNDVDLGYNDGSPSDAATCTAAQCGPALGIANYTCADGSTGGPTGRCIANAEGQCAWEIRSCPPAEDGGTQTCTSNADCTGGKECLGAPGCGTPWTCEGPLGRACSSTMAPFCDCAGNTVSLNASCPDQPYAHAGACGTGTGDGGIGPTDGGTQTCTSNADCTGGKECLGAPGCGTPWTCEGPLGRACSSTMAPFCDCAGNTVSLNASCPDQPYAHAGACP